MKIKFELEKDKFEDKKAGDFLFYSNSTGNYFYVIIQREYGMSAMGHRQEDCVPQTFYMVDIERGRIAWDLIENLHHYVSIKPKDNKIVFVEK